MKKWLFIILALSTGALFFVPYERSLTFIETRTERPEQFFLPLKNEETFQLVFTHSIHLTDVIESYKVLPTDSFQLLAMEYTDVAIGMPGYAEEGQTLHYENGVYTLKYMDAQLKEFTLHIGDVDYKLNVLHKGKSIPLKEHLVRGKSYLVIIQSLSLYDKMKGVELND